MQVQELHYQFKLNMDRVDTLSNPDFNAAEIDWLLNEAQLIFVKQRYSTNNLKRSGFENTQKRIDDLSPLVVKFPTQPAITPTLTSGIYEVPLSSLAYQYLFLVNIYVDATINNCSVRVPLKFVQHDDIARTLRDPFDGPSDESFPYNFGAASTTGTSIYIYPGSYTIENVYIEYLRYPSRISRGTYTYIDGTVYPPATSELPDHTHPEIVDIATQLASLNIESPEYIQLRNQKVLINE